MIFAALSSSRKPFYHDISLVGRNAKLGRRQKRERRLKAIDDEIFKNKVARFKAQPEMNGSAKRPTLKW